MCWVVMHLEFCDIFLEKKIKIVGFFLVSMAIHVYVTFNLNLQKIEKKEGFCPCNIEIIGILHSMLFTFL